MSRRGESRNQSHFYLELRKRLEENRKLYDERSFFKRMDNLGGRLLAAQLGNNPWKVLIPASFVLSLVLRYIFGKGYSDFVLRILGGP